MTCFSSLRRPLSGLVRSRRPIGSPLCVRGAATVPRRCDVVVVGGGVVGCATARALAQRGASVVLLEQNGLTSGTTWHAAGLMGTLKGSTLIMQMARYGLERYKEMVDPETGRNEVGWANTGSLTVARCHDSMEQLARHCQAAHSLGHMHHRVVSAADIAEIHPFLNLEGVVGGVYSPEDGIVNPGDVAMWMAKEARSMGATVLEHTEVSDIDFDRSTRRAARVRTEHRASIECDSVVLCGGAWSKKLSRKAFGENRVPVAMAPHQYIIFDKIEGVSNDLPVVRDLHHKYYLKPEVGGFMLGIFEGDPVPHLPESARAQNGDRVERPREAAHELYDESIDKAGEWLELAFEDVPALGEVGIKQWLNGPDTHSTDHAPILGRMPGTDNVFLGTGFNSQGIQMGPAAGVALAEFVLDGAPHSLGADFSSAEPSRVPAQLCQDSYWLSQRALEGYGKTYDVHYPLEVFESARGRRHTPFHEHWASLGARFGETFGWERPLYFPRPGEEQPGKPSQWLADGISSPPHSSHSFHRADCGYFAAERRECLAARERAALFDLSSFGKLRVRGPRSLELLQWCLTADMDKPEGALTYSLFCNARGGVLGDLTVARLGPEDFYVVTLANQPRKVLDHLRREAARLSLTADVHVEDVTEARAVLALNGPASRAILEPLLDPSSLFVDALDDAKFPAHTAQRLKLAGAEVLALRVSYAGEYGWELHHAPEHSQTLLSALVEAGKPHGLLPGGMFALLNSLRLEKGFVHYGADVSLTETPLEAGLGFACKLKAEQCDFVGKQAILAQRKGGITRRLVNISGPEGAAPAPEGGVTFWGHEQELVYRDGAAVGTLTSGGHSHTLDRALGLALIAGPPKMPQSWIEEGIYEVQVPQVLPDGRVVSRRVPVEASTKCLVDPMGLRMKQPVQQAGDVFLKKWTQQLEVETPSADAHSPNLPGPWGLRQVRIQPQQMRRGASPTTQGHSRSLVK